MEHNYVPLSIQNFNNRFSRLAIQKMNEKDYLLAKIFFSKAPGQAKRGHRQGDKAISVSDKHNNHFHKCNVSHWF